MCVVTETTCACIMCSWEAGGWCWGVRLCLWVSVCVRALMCADLLMCYDNCNHE